MLNSGKLKLTKQHYESLQNAIAFVKMRWDRETLLQFQTIIGPKVCKHCDGSGKVSIGTTLDKRLELRVSDICRGIIMGREMKTLDRNTNLRDFI